MVQKTVPADYTLVSQHVNSNSVDYYFINEQAEEISVSVFFLSGWDTTITLDTEDAQTEISVIGNQRATVIRKENRYQITWIDSEEQSMYVISGTSGAQQLIGLIANDLLDQ